MSIITKIPGGNELLNASAVLQAAGITEGMRVADLGCGGQGHFSLAAARAVGASGWVYAVDVLPGVLRSVESHARANNLGNLKTVLSNLEILGATDIKSATLDAALLINTLFQMERRLTALKEAVRMLKTGGLLVVVDWRKNGAAFGPLENWRLDTNELKSQVMSAGAELTKEFQAGPYHFGLVFKKL